MIFKAKKNATLQNLVNVLKTANEESGKDFYVKRYPDGETYIVEEILQTNKEVNK